MKYCLYISLFLLLFSVKSNAQIDVIDDTLAVVKLDNSFRTSQSSFEFDLVLRRSSDIWRYFANSTFQFIFDDVNYDYNKLNVELLPLSSELLPVTPGVQPYKIMQGTLSDRIQIIILGPKNIDESFLIAPNQAVKVGRFRISSKDGSEVPDYLYWKRPILYYQAASFKYDSDDPEPPFMVVVNEEDNIDMSNASTNFVSYDDDESVPPAMSIDFFNAEYVGNLKVNLWFKTYSEYRAKGFIIKRALRVSGLNNDLESIPDENFTHLVADYRNQPYIDMLTAQFTSRIGKEYGIVNDEIDIRGVDYIYRLYYQDADDNIIKLVTRALAVPNAVIEYAQADPNPFSDLTTVRYFVRDDVILSCYVFDRIGQIIAKLKDENSGKVIEKLETKKGWHTTTFKANELTSQGSYDIVFLAYPLNDNSVEMSRAVVKVQFVIDRKR